MLPCFLVIGSSNLDVTGAMIWTDGASLRIAMSNARIIAAMIDLSFAVLSMRFIFIAINWLFCFAKEWGLVVQYLLQGGRVNFFSPANAQCHTRQSSLSPNWSKAIPGIYASYRCVNILYIERDDASYRCVNIIHNERGCIIIMWQKTNSQNSPPAQPHEADRIQSIAGRVADTCKLR